MANLLNNLILALLFCATAATAVEARRTKLYSIKNGGQEDGMLSISNDGICKTMDKDPLSGLSSPFHLVLASLRATNPEMLLQFALRLPHPRPVKLQDCLGSFVAASVQPKIQDELRARRIRDFFGVSCHGELRAKIDRVTTEDGYILSMQRIYDHTIQNKSTPVLLQHGLLMDGITWLLNPPNQSLAFILADNGFDVWVANTRGTKYSSGHTSLTPNDSAYWDWSWDELVSYDLPASFQYVYDQTGQQKLHYVGHSLGTLIALAAFSQEKLLSMLRSAALLSPIAYMGQMPSPLARGAADIFLAEDLYWLGLHEFDPKGVAVINLLKDICNQPDIDCTNLMTSFTGQNCCLNSSITNAFLDHEPQPTSTKNMIHLAQMIRQGKIAKYDYGNEDENMEHYGQTTPPLYNMSSIPNDIPLFLSYGGQDKLSDVNDVEMLLDSLKDHDGDTLVVLYRDDYAHADFVMAVNAKQVVYNPLMAFFRLN